MVYSQDSQKPDTAACVCLVVSDVPNKIATIMVFLCGQHPFFCLWNKRSIDLIIAKRVRNWGGLVASH